MSLFHLFNLTQRKGVRGEILQMDESDAALKCFPALNVLKRIAGNG